MIRLILIGQVVFFFMLGVFLVDARIKTERVEAVAATYRDMPMKALGEINI